MKPGLIFSLALNALLPGLMLWLALAGSRHDTPAPGSRLMVDHILRAEHQPAPPPMIEPSPEVVEVNEPFNWAQIEATDYRVYVANLRAIGCPESTVRDIAIADVNDLFQGHVKALVDEVSGQFWYLLTHEQDFKKVVEEKGEQLSALKKERDEIFNILFGHSNPLADDDEEQRASAATQREQWERFADFLPEEKRAQFAAAKDELEQEWSEVLRMPGLTDAQRQSKRKELDSAHDQAMREWLTPGEFDELRLRQSPAASLRDRLVGLDLSDDEVRAVARIQLATTDAQAALSRKDADFKSRPGQLQQESEVRTRELLGEGRYAALQRATDSRYEPIHRVTQRLELPGSTAVQAYDIRRQAEDAARLLRDNKSLSDGERQAMLQAVGAETRQSLSATLGPKGFAAYEKIDGGWMQQMSAPRP